MDELTKEFLLESGEGLDRMELALGEMENGLPTAYRIGEIFRAVHTIKGATGFLGFGRLEKLAHAGENLLGLIRDGKRSATPAVIAGMLKLLDELRGILALIEQTGDEGASVSGQDDAVLISWLQELANGNEIDSVEGERRFGMTEKIGSETQTHKAGSVENTLRVEVETLNRLMNLVGELVQTRNQILGHPVAQRMSEANAGCPTRQEGESFARMGQRLDSVTAQLRETVMQARMQPVGQLFQRFPRMVRELEHSCGKRVRLEFAGSETGLDKSLLEALKDPLSHSIRNAVDHGIESASERVRRGKTLQGTIRLRAFQEGGSVVVEVADDGGGVDVKKVLERAVERRLISAEHARTISEAEALELLFEPGFSTRDQVSMVSGRGVGMDVVRSNVEGVGGSVEMDSVAGEGTTLRMRMPLTLAIIPALIARCGGHSFAIPQSALVEMQIVSKEDEDTVVERVGEARLFRLNDRLVPLLSLPEILGVAGQLEHGFYIAVLESKGQRFGLMIDDLAEPQEIVVKPLSNVLRSLDLYSGASALSDGSLALILDIAGLARAGGLSEAVERAKVASTMPAANEVQAVPMTAKSMLVFEDHANERKVLPMDCLERIESVARGSVEFVSDHLFLQYRGSLLELEDPGRLFSRDQDQSQQRMVLICKRSDQQRVGIVVTDVLDIADAETMPERGVGSSDGTSRLALVRSRLATVLHGFEQTQLPAALGRAA